MKRLRLAKYGFVTKVHFSNFTEKLVEIISWLAINLGLSDGVNWFVRFTSNTISIYINSDKDATFFKLTWVTQ